MSTIIYVLIAVALLAVLVGVVITIKRNNAIRQGGIETDAVVSRIKENETQNDDGSRQMHYTYYVQYQTEDGQTVEAKLGKAPLRIAVGDRLRIKYLPEKPKYVITV